MLNIITKPFSWYSSNIQRILFFTCCTLLAILFLERVYLIFSYQAQFTGIDNNFDYPIIRSLAGYSIYPNPAEYPYAVNPYAPLFFIISKIIAAALHVAPENTLSIFQISRSVALLADGGTCLVLFSILNNQGESRRKGAIMITSLVFGILCYLGYTFNRSDSVFLFFYSCTWYYVFKLKWENRLARPLLIALFMTMTIFSKQNGISLLFLLPTWFILEKNYRQLLQFILFAILFCSGAFLYFEYVFTNHFFSEHVIHALKNRIDPKWFYVNIFKLLADSQLIIPLGTALVLAFKLISKNKKRVLVNLSVAYIAQLIFSVTLSFKWGSSLGYLNESYFLAFILGFLFLSEPQAGQTRTSIKSNLIYIYPVLLLFMLHIILQLYAYFIHDKTSYQLSYKEQVSVSDYLKKKIGDKQQYVLNLDRPDLDFFKNILYKEMAAPNSDAVNCCTLPDKTFNYDGLMKGLTDGRIQYLIENKKTKESSLWGISLDNYIIDTTFSNYVIYKFDASKKR